MTATVIRLPVLSEPAAIASTLAVSGIGATSGDPIFKAIQRHRVALRARWTVFAVYGVNVSPGDPNSQKAESRIDAAMKREYRELRALLACRPQTTAGFLALLDHVGQWEDPPEEGLDNRSIIAGAVESEYTSAHDWSLYLSAIARGLIEANERRS